MGAASTLTPLPTPTNTIWACSVCGNVWPSWAGRSQSSPDSGVAQPSLLGFRSEVARRVFAMTEVRVFLADDHAVVREGLKAMINTQSGIKVVWEASDGLAACQQVAELKPDVVVMDVSMPGLTGSQATERLKQECPLVKVLALTVHEDKGYIRQLLAAGASGYVLKRAAPEELIHAIRVVAAGGVYLDPTMAGKVVGGFVQRPTADSSGTGG